MAPNLFVWLFLYHTMSEFKFVRPISICVFCPFIAEGNPIITIEKAVYVHSRRVMAHHSTQMSLVVKVQNLHLVIAEKVEISNSTASI